MKQKIKSKAIKLALKTTSKIYKKTGVKISFEKVKDDIFLYKKLYGEESVKTRRFYNICAGGHGGFGGYFYHPCWTNVDVEAPILLDEWERFNPEKDIWHDLLDKNPLPIESDSAEIIQSQYAIEHITNNAADYFFKEVYRVLKTDGVFKVVTPNIALDYMAYKNNDASYYWWVDVQSSKKLAPVYGNKIPLNQASLEQVAIVHFAANASTIHEGNNPNRIEDDEFRHVMNTMKMEEAYDYCIDKCSIKEQRKYRATHINWWNHEKLITKLKQAGFSRVYIVAPGQSSSPILRNRDYFDNMWNDVALFVEAIK